MGGDPTSCDIGDARYAGGDPTKGLLCIKGGGLWKPLVQLCGRWCGTPDGGRAPLDGKEVALKPFPDEGKDLRGSVAGLPT
ncbi:hypothetical protein FF2_041752 [Malus domestica]